MVLWRGSCRAASGVGGNNAALDGGAGYCGWCCCSRATTRPSSCDRRNSSVIPVPGVLPATAARRGQVTLGPTHLLTVTRCARAIGGGRRRAAPRGDGDSGGDFGPAISIGRVLTLQLSARWARTTSDGAGQGAAGDPGLAGHVLRIGRHGAVHGRAEVGLLFAGCSWSSRSCVAGGWNSTRRSAAGTTSRRRRSHARLGAG